MKTQDSEGCPRSGISRFFDAEGHYIVFRARLWPGGGRGLSLQPPRSLLNHGYAVCGSHVHQMYSKDHALKPTCPVSCLSPTLGAKNCMCATPPVPIPSASKSPMCGNRFLGVSTGVSDVSTMFLESPGALLLKIHICARRFTGVTLKQVQ